MKRLLFLSKTLLAAAAVTVLVAASAYAQGGINLSWNDCGLAGAGSRTFACTSNSGASTLFASAVPPVLMTQFVGYEGVIDLQTNQTTLSAWWGLDATGCRSAALSQSLNFLANSNCTDPWANQASGGINASPGFGGANRERIRSVAAVPGSSPVTLDPTAPGGGITAVGEYYMFEVLISNVKTAGLGACPGCTDGACIVLNSVKLASGAGTGGPTFTLTNPVNRSFVTWQSGGSIGGQCPAAVPTHSTTWGAVKSIYR